MKILETVFFILMIIVPLFFILIGLSSIKRVKRNKKFRKKLLMTILLSFIINASFYEVIRMNNEGLNSIIDDNKINETIDKEKDEDINKEENANMEEETKDDNRENSTQNDDKENDEKPVVNTNVTSKGYEIKNINGITYIDGHLIVNKTYTLKEDYIPTNTHKTATSETGICQECIDEEAYKSYVNMRNDASREGLSLWIASGYRSYNYQKGLYEGYVKRSGQVAADTFSARPGHSEHQSGLAFDLNSVTDAFATTKEGVWVNANCHKYGFIIRYPKGKEDETGYKYESWHLRYVGVELAEKLYNNGEWITMEDYFGISSKYAY